MRYDLYCVNARLTQTYLQVVELSPARLGGDFFAVRPLIKEFNPRKYYWLYCTWFYGKFFVDSESEIRTVKFMCQF